MICRSVRRSDLFMSCINVGSQLLGTVLHFAIQNADERNYGLCTTRIQKKPQFIAGATISFKFECLH